MEKQFFKQIHKFLFIYFSIVHLTIFVEYTDLVTMNKNKQK